MTKRASIKECVILFISLPQVWQPRKSGCLPCRPESNVRVKVLRLDEGAPTRVAIDQISRKPALGCSLCPAASRERRTLDRSDCGGPLCAYCSPCEFRQRSPAPRSPFHPGPRGKACALLRPGSLLIVCWNSSVTPGPERRKPHPNGFLLQLVNQRLKLALNRRQVGLPLIASIFDVDRVTWRYHW